MTDSRPWLTRSEIARSLQLAVAFLAPVAIGVGVHHALTGLLIGIGAFMVANADLGESYAQRLRLMVPATLAIAGMMAAGMATGTSEALTVAVGVVVFLLAGLAASLGQEAALFSTFAAFAYVIGTGLADSPGLSIFGVVWPVLAGGALALVLSAVNAGLVQHPPDEPSEPWRSLPHRARQRLDRKLFRHVLALTIAGGIALAIVPATHQSSGAWLVTGALIVLKPGYHDTVRTALVRAAGTVVGAAAAAAIAAGISQQRALIVAAFLLTWAAEAMIGHSFAAFVVLITPLSILLSNVLVPGDWQVLLVAVSINLSRILEFPQLPDRAAGTLGLVMTILLICILILAPQGRAALGTEILILGAVMTAGALRASLARGHGDRGPAYWVLVSLLILLLPALLLTGGGISLLVHGGGGPYWVLAGICTGFAASVINTWVLLVEIQR